MKLKPCPFCGGEADVWSVIIDDENYYEVYCTACDCMTPKFHTEKSAIQFWNRREPIEKIVEQLEERKQEEGNVTLTKIAYNTAIEDAIEIVKGGEADEDSSM